jgi:tryptophan synthase alpha chain
MDRISELFNRKKARVLNLYCTAGFPKANSTVEVMSALQESGVDMIELGMPYSDPLADGPVIQASSAKAIENGMTIAKLFSDLGEFRSHVNVPVVLMGYMNPVLQYGFDRFCKDAAGCGIDGLILPDLPLFEFETEYRSLIEKYGLKCIFLVTPETSHDRVKKIDALSTGFLYAVSSSSTTGIDKKIEQQSAYFERLNKIGLRNPVLVGFGIKDKESFEAACKYCAGAIIGTAYIKAIENAEDLSSATKKFIDGIIK